MRLFIVSILLGSASAFYINCATLTNPESRAALHCDEQPTAVKPIQSVAKPTDQISKPNIITAGDSCSCNIPEGKLSMQEKTALKSLRAQAFFHMWPLGDDTFNNPEVGTQQLSRLFALKSENKAAIIGLISGNKALDQTSAESVLWAEENARRLQTALPLSDFLDIFRVPRINLNVVSDALYNKIIPKQVDASKMSTLLKVATEASIQKRSPRVTLSDASKEEACMVKLKLGGDMKSEFRATIHLYSLLIGYFTKELSFEKAQEAIQQSVVPVQVIPKQQADQEKVSLELKLAEENLAHEKALQGQLATERAIADEKAQWQHHTAQEREFAQQQAITAALKEEHQKQAILSAQVEEQKGKVSQLTSAHAGLQKTNSELHAENEQLQLTIKAKDERIVTLENVMIKIRKKVGNV